LRLAHYSSIGFDVVALHDAQSGAGGNGQGLDPLRVVGIGDGALPKSTKSEILGSGKAGNPAIVGYPLAYLTERSRAGCTFSSKREAASTRGLGVNGESLA
jgi:hypothetical protein